LLNDHLLPPPRFRTEKRKGGSGAAIADEPGHGSGRDVG
jgi:hypothetical protein